MTNSTPAPPTSSTAVSAENNAIVLNTAPLLDVRDLAKSFRKKKVVKNVSMHVAPGEIVGLLGPNGAGKTTTFYMIVGLEHADSGAIHFQGTDVLHVPMYKRARLGMGYLSQEPSIFRNLSVADNIMAVLETLTLSKKERKSRLADLLAELELTHLAEQRACTLSGGERRRLEITRALATNPSFIMLDEPFAGIDPINIYEVQKMITHLKDKGLGVLITDHNVRDTLDIVQRAYLICDGEILCEGDSTYLTNDENAKRLYLGPRFSEK